jgi:hypothetical protein
VLGYSALRFGVGSVVLAGASTAGAIAGQAALLRAGFRSAAAAGLALIGAGSGEKFLHPFMSTHPGTETQKGSKDDAGR